MIENKKIEKNVLDNFIDKELEIKPNPFLAAKVMGKIAIQNINGVGKPTYNKSGQSIIFNLAMVFSAAAVLALGIFLGSNYNFPNKYNSNKQSIALQINDTQLENLSLYDVEE